MNNFIKAGIISAAIATSPLTVSSENFEKDNLKNQTGIELATALRNPDNADNLLYISPSVMTQAVLDYFDEEVKLYKLSADAKTQIKSILNTYFASHYIFQMKDDGKLKFVIDDKKEFSIMVKKLVNVVINDVPFFVRKVRVPIFLGSNETIQRKLDNLDTTFFDLKEKQYKDVVLDYMGGIAKRMASSINGEITVGEYYGGFSSYFPNKNGKNISDELTHSGQINQDLRYYKYKR